MNENELVIETVSIYAAFSKSSSGGVRLFAKVPDSFSNFDG